MKKISMIVCFCALLLLPNLCGMMFEPMETESTENRELAKKPVLEPGNIRKFPAQAEAYINDHAPFRNLFIDAYASFNMEAFHSIDNREVFRGKDGWLFYTGNESVIDMLGVAPFTEEQMEMILDRLLAVRERYGQDGFIFFIAPNKEIIYRDMLPDHYAPLTDTSKALELVRYIREHSDIQVVYPMEELKKAREDSLLYYKTDTHWNELGGFIGTQELIRAAGGEAVDYHELSVCYEDGARGDLGDLGHTPMRYLKEAEAVLTDYYDNVTAEILENDGGPSRFLRARTAKAPDQRRLTVAGDSFSIAMAPVLMKYFGETTFIGWERIKETDLSQYPADMFVYEIVERNLGRMSMDLDALLEQ